VDDDPLIRRVGRMALDRAGHDVEVAGSIAEALQELQEDAFDVAILDYFLEAGECGCDLIPPLRARQPSIKIIIMSGLGVLGELVRHAHAAGADLVASKPHIDWLALARGQAEPSTTRCSAAVDLATLKRDIIHGAFLVHRRNVSLTARALGIKRSSLQRRLRKSPLPDVEDE